MCKVFFFLSLCHINLLYIQPCPNNCKTTTSNNMVQPSDSRDTFRALHMSICGLPKDWRRRPGHPRHTWLQTLEADLQPLNHGLNSAW